MPMLFIETFLLMLLAGLLGVAVGSLIGCRDCCGAEWDDDRPWLREGRVAPPAPALPAAPTLLSSAERTRLAASLAEAEAAAAARPAPAPAAEPVAVPTPATEPAAAPEPEPTPAPEPAPVVASVVESAAVEPAAPAPAPAEPAAAVAPAAAYELPAEIAAAAVAPTVAAEDAGRAAAADAVGTRPLALAAPLGGKADDLKRIRGIGPQNERKLHGLGVYHFSQIAAWTAENAKWAGSFMAFPGRIEREEWIAQATILATGAETAFSKRVDAGEVPTSQSDGRRS